MRRLVIVWWLLFGLATPGRAADLPIFDAHLHYNEEALAAYPVDRVLDLFRRHGVRGILASSRPNAGTHRLVEAAQDTRGQLWVVPFFRPYRVPSDVGTWFRDPEIFALMQAELGSRAYRGIGEFHLHGADAGGDLVRRMVALSVERGLWLHAHSDEDAIEALYRHDPRARIIWAHTGFSAPAASVARLIEAHPTLMCELSYRSGIVDGAGRLTPEWRDLFTRYPDRFLVGSDTWNNQRLDSYGSVIEEYRQWLAQLPVDVARRIALGNAERLFGAPPEHGRSR
jgi:Amidohydrolase